jgi:hypothetical protein
VGRPSAVRRSYRRVPKRIDAGTQVVYGGVDQKGGFIAFEHWVLLPHDSGHPVWVQTEHLGLAHAVEDLEEADAELEKAARPAAHPRGGRPGSGVSK